jgi:hypothetical protein
LDRIPTGYEPGAYYAAKRKSYTDRSAVSIEDESSMRKVGIAKLNGTNYRPWAVIVKALIEAKEA